MFIHPFISNAYENNEGPTLPAKIIKKILDLGKIVDTFDKCFEENESILQEIRQERKEKKRLEG